MYDFKKREEEVLKFWKEKKIYEKIKGKNSKGKKFYLMDGPPYATGHIHMGTALNKILKDIAIRSKRSQGYNVFERAGYDTHGIPIEYQIEKEIGTKTKRDIERYGVKKFIEKCKKFATKFIGVMNKEFINLGVWMDFKDPYLTLDNGYIETIWDTFKEAYRKRLLYLGEYPIHVCHRCETAVAYNEIEYKKQEDTAIYVKFPLKKEKNKFLVIWTTTPWTLPGNTGIMVNPKIEYSEVELNKEETLIIAKEKVQEIMSKIETNYSIRKTYEGKKLNGIKYENPLSKYLNLKVKDGYRVVLSSRYVNIEEGTGLVHCAPGHGKEDYEVGKEKGLDIISPVGIDGLFEKEAGKYSGKKARIVDEEIIEDLEKDGFILYKHKYTHDYPLCWRCKNPLLMITRPQWFFKIDKIHKKLLSSNKKVNWVPSYMKLRMKAWLEGISDWPISRSRYWGTPLPIWKCEGCKEIKIIGSIKELEKESGRKIRQIHKPEIDKIKIKCFKCSGKMNRVPEVLDVWFDSGVSSWSALGYLKEKKLFKKFWPADLNLEGKDQIRGWWNSQIILSEIKFEKKPFDSILVHGMVLDLEKRKMSKSLGNVISLQEIINKYGRDQLRYYFAETSKGEDFAFDENEFKNIGQVFNILKNLNNYIKNIGGKSGEIKKEDKWIVSRFNSVVEEIIESYNKYNFSKATELFEGFLLNDLSRNYIKIIRERENEHSVKKILEEINLGLLKLISPICPFITEYFFKNYKKEKSIHLEKFPKPNKKKVDKKLEQEFENALRIIECGLAARDKVKIGLKWPLKSAIIYCDKKLNRDILEIISRQLNVKKINLKEAKKISVKFDTKLTSELETEGYAREISRQVQSFRKKLGLEKKDKIGLLIFTDDKFKNILDKQKKFIKERTNSKKLEIVTTGKERFKNNIDFKIKDKRGKIIIITTNK